MGTLKKEEKAKGMTYGELCAFLEKKTGKHWGLCSIDLNDGQGTKAIGFKYSNNPFPNKNYKTISQSALVELVRKQYGIDPYGKN